VARVIPLRCGDARYAIKPCFIAENKIIGCTFPRASKRPPFFSSSPRDSLGVNFSATFTAKQAPNAPRLFSPDVFAGPGTSLMRGTENGENDRNTVSPP